ncbi:unnamed protein product [Moneuplotes crassus]|uniref:non-specific serine/threonine protein kinase n=1 Tax=Euplotes crassus TaxID=5936 RepID=A0AAD1UEJ9_EUPCR|nr:unnamed protein product [Moneuplotes crassus]
MKSYYEMVKDLNKEFTIPKLDDIDSNNSDPLKEFRDLDFLKEIEPISEFEKESVFQQIEEQFDKVPGKSLVRAIGKGGFGKVYPVTHIQTEMKVALKYIEKNTHSDINSIERLCNEINILKKVRHPNIVKLYQTFEDPDNLILCTEYLDLGDLFDYTTQRERLTEKEARRLFRQIIFALSYLHSIRICHRDLKLQNVLIDQNKNAKLIDFGFSKEYSKGEKLNETLGTPAFSSPEIILRKPYFPEKVDVWGCGIILYFLLTGKHPFANFNKEAMYKNILNGKIKPHRSINNRVERLLKGIFNVDQNKRFTLEDIREHEWFGDYEIEDIRGFELGKELIEVNESLVKRVEELGYDYTYTKDSVEMYIHNNESMVYYLLYKKYLERQANDTLNKMKEKRLYTRAAMFEEKKRPERIDTKASLLTAPIQSKSPSNLSDSIQEDRSGLKPCDINKIWTSSQKLSFINRGGKSKFSQFKVKN